MLLQAVELCSLHFGAPMAAEDINYQTERNSDLAGPSPWKQ